MVSCYTYIQIYPAHHTLAHTKNGHEALVYTALHVLYVDQPTRSNALSSLTKIIKSPSTTPNHPIALQVHPLHTHPIPSHDLPAPCPRVPHTYLPTSNPLSHLPTSAYHSTPFHSITTLNITSPPPLLSSPHLTAEPSPYPTSIRAESTK